jgi:hypothetical protein
MNKVEITIKDSINKSVRNPPYPSLFTLVHDSIPNTVYLLLFIPVRNRLFRLVRLTIDDSVRRKNDE